MLTVLTGDAIEQLRTLPSESVHCCVTSPPYWGLRDYSTNGQLGLEKTPEEYVAKMVKVFREVRRVLRKDGTLWMNMGDSYNSPNTHTGKADKVDWGLQRVLDAKANAWIGNKNLKPKDLLGMPWRVAFALQADGWWLRSDVIWAKPNPMPESCTDRPTKSHEYLFLLTKSANYFYDAEAIREAVQEWNTPSGRENAAGVESQRAVEREKLGALAGGRGWKVAYNNPAGRNKRSVWTVEDDAQLARWLSENEPEAWERFRQEARNKKDVWKVATEPYPEAHFATYPCDLIKPCILAGTSAKGCCAKCGSPWERGIERGESSWEARNAAGHKTSGYHAEDGAISSFDTPKMPAGRKAEGGLWWVAESKTIGWQPTCKCVMDHSILSPNTIPCTVLDPFAGSGTTGAVALELGRKAILIELNPKYVELIRQRCDITPGLQLA